MACTLPSCFLAGDVGGGERKVGGFCFPKTRVEWRVEWSGGEEKRRECDVWPRVEWSGVEEKRRKESFLVSQNAALHLHVFFMYY